MFTKEFWKATLIRAIRTFAESALAFIGTGAVVLNTTIASQHDGTSNSTSSCGFKSMTSKVTVPALAKLLSLYPVDAEKPVGNIWHRNAGERLALRGGSYNGGAGCGLFALGLNNDRTGANGGIGFRPAFIL